MLRNVILDWSGTLVDDLAPIIEATNLIFRHYGRPELLREEFRRHFRLPFDGFYAELLPGVPLAELDELYHAHFVDRQDAVVLLPHAIQFLGFCRAAGIRTFLLSTIKPEHFAAQSSRLGVAHFFETAYVGIMDKRERIKGILAENKLVPSETAFIGDMVHDIETAKHGGVIAIATLTGFDSLEKLSAADPGVIVRDLGELQKLLDHSDSSRDEIHIEALELKATIGVPGDERRHPQRLTASITLQLPHGFETLDDDVAKTVDYAVVCNEVKTFVTGRSDKLIETLAENIAAHLLAKFPIARVRIELRKFILPDTAHVAVTIERNREGTAI